MPIDLHVRYVGAQRVSTNHLKSLFSSLKLLRNKSLLVWLCILLGKSPYPPYIDEEIQTRNPPQEKKVSCHWANSGGRILLFHVYTRYFMSYSKLNLHVSTVARALNEYVICPSWVFVAADKNWIRIWTLVKPMLPNSWDVLVHGLMGYAIRYFEWYVVQRGRLNWICSCSPFQGFNIIY